MSFKWLALLPYLAGHCDLEDLKFWNTNKFLKCFFFLVSCVWTCWDIFHVIYEACNFFFLNSSFSLSLFEKLINLSNVSFSFSMYLHLLSHFASCIWGLYNLCIYLFFIFNWYWDTIPTYVSSTTGEKSFTGMLCSLCNSTETAYACLAYEINLCYLWYNDLSLR